MIGRKKTLLIEASNIGGSGGAITHLKEFLVRANLKEYHIEKVIVCCSNSTYAKIEPSKSEIYHHQHEWLNGGYVLRLLWKVFIFRELLRKNKPLLFIPGGGDPFWTYPFVTMFRNLLPMDKKERDRFKYSVTWFRYLLLNRYFSKSYIRANGVICLNEYCYNSLPSRVRKKLKSYKTIAHGLNNRFKTRPKEVFDFQSQIKVLYVSRINLYKHQWVVAEAVLKLKQLGHNIKLQLIGSQDGPGREKLNNILNTYQESTDTVELIEEVSQRELVDYYENADIFVFASSCETFGMILLEAMGMGLPIICSNRSSLPGLLKSNGLYFDPENVDSLFQSLLQIISNKKLREELGRSAHKEALEYQWNISANQTLEYIVIQCQNIHAK